MERISPGHIYILKSLDGDVPQVLTFVKREGPGYPGNHGSHPGTNVQEVLRALIDRCKYINHQKPCAETEAALHLLEAALLLFETRAARQHGRTVAFTDIFHMTSSEPCRKCGHLQCQEHV